VAAITAAIIATAGITAGIIYAAAAPPVGTDLTAIGYQNVVDSGDLFFLIRYDLPEQTVAFGTPVTTPEAWCAELLNQDGCIGTSSQPTDPTSLRDSAVFATLYSDAGATIVEEQSAVTRIGHALGGVYVSPGSTLTFGDTDYRICIDPSTIIYSPATPRCTAIAWNGAAATIEAQRAQLGADLVVQLQALELLRGVGTNQYVINNKITTGGKILALDALAIIDRIIPEFFQIGAITAIGTIYPTTIVGSLPLQQTVTANAAATGLDVSFQNAGQTLMGNGTVWTALVSLALSGGIAYVVMAITKNSGQLSMPLTVVTFLTCQMMMIWILWPTISVLMVTIFLLSIPGSWYMLRRAPAG
jgi:hypothetical protein